MPGCTRFASPPFFDEAMIPENTVIDPELIGVLRRELVRQCVAISFWQKSGPDRQWQRDREGEGGDPGLPSSSPQVRRNFAMREEFREKKITMENI
jgi:hypothetical protein